MSEQMCQAALWLSTACQRALLSYKVHNPRSVGHARTMKDRLMNKSFQLNHYETMLGYSSREKRTLSRTWKA